MKEGAMFTGIIESLGTLTQKNSHQLIVQSPEKLLSKLTEGSSIAINGVCLTVVALDKDSFTVDFIPETYQKTNIKAMSKGDLVNLELPATPQTYLSGHLIQGHIDGVVKLIDITKKGNSLLLKFSLPNSLARYLVEKGSVAVNGISLTVIKAGKSYFTVGIIPHTWNNTNLYTLREKDLVNLEVDILAKYLERLLKR